MRPSRASPVRYKPKSMKAKNLYAQIQANADERAKRKKLEVDNRLGLNDLESIDDVTLNSVLDSVRPEFKDEAQRLQRRLQEIIAEGKTSVADFERDYNDNAPFPSEVRINRKEVEVSAQLPPKRTGAARKSFNRWQPIKPSQAARRDGSDTFSAGKSRNDHTAVQKHFQSRPITHDNPRGEAPATLTAEPGHGTTRQTSGGSKRTVISITSDSESSVAPAKKISGASTGATVVQCLSPSPKRDKQTTSLRRRARYASRWSSYNETPTVFESPQSKMLFQLATAEDLRTHFGTRVPGSAGRANRPKNHGRGGSMSDGDAQTHLEDIPAPEYSSGPEKAVGRTAYTAQRSRFTAGTLDDFSKPKYSGTARPKEHVKATVRSFRTAQPNAGRRGGQLQTSNQKTFAPGLAMSNCTDSPDSGREQASPMGALSRRVRKKKAVAIRRHDPPMYTDSEDEDIRAPRRKLRGGKSGTKTKLVMPSDAFPANDPPTRFIPPMKLAERQKEIRQKPVETAKIHPEARHKRAINRTDLSFVTKPAEKEMISRVRITSTPPKPVGAVRMPPQECDPQLGEEAYRGRIFRTIERDLEEGLFGSHLPDDGFDADIRNPQNDPESERESAPREPKEDILARYMEIAESDPYAGFY